MSSVFDLVKIAGTIPLDELVWRSPADAGKVKAEVAELESLGLVKLREAPLEGLKVVELTSRGLKQAIAG